jgi:hypothetical protein
MHLTRVFGNSFDSWVVGTLMLWYQLPIGASGVLLKFQLPSRTAYADSFDLFSIGVAC